MSSMQGAMRASAKAASGEMRVPFPGYERGYVGVVCAVSVRALAFHVPAIRTIVALYVNFCLLRTKEAPYVLVSAFLLAFGHITYPGGLFFLFFKCWMNG